ncbi:sporozoite surface protein 2-like isoform X1 [Channa argus]|uniref:sporozoite surface protein 2-like isoform X1 n=2 Tax=Channa argus TaxID=215402 RepID=UPI0035202B98
MITSTICSSSEVSQTDYEDTAAPQLPTLPMQNHMMTSTNSSSSEVPQSDYEDPDAPDYEDPDAPQQPKRPSPNQTMASTSSSSSEVPQADSKNPDAPDYEDPESPQPAVTDRSQSEHEVKPVPLPRSKIKTKAECSSRSDSSDPVDKSNSPSTDETSHDNECPSDNKRPHPVRPPQRPPMSKLLNSAKPTPENQYTSANTKPTVKRPAVGTERTRNAHPRPERPPPPSLYYGRAPATQSKSCSGESEQSTCSSSSSKQTALSDKVINLDGSYREMAKDSKNKPAVPPRPMQSLLPSYASLCESSPPQIRPPAPLPPAETLSEPVYSEIGIDIDNCPYLEILPNKENKMIKPPPSIPPTEKRSRSVHSEKEHLLLLTENKDKMKQRWTLPRSGPPVGSNRYSQRPQTIEDADDIGGMLRWLKKVSKPDYMTPSVYGLSIEEEVRSFNQRAVHVSKALRLYNLLMMKRNESLRNIITEFSSISDSLDKMQKKSKTVDIAGGTTGAIGGVTAVVGIALAPMTLGASLIATAVGAGMVASAGGLSAHTAKASEKIVNRTSVEMLVDEYMTNVVDLEHCLDFILAGMNELRRHDIARLNRAGTQSEAVKMAHLSQSVFKTTTTNNNKNLGTSVAHTSGVSSEKLLQAFSKEMDQYFRENGQKLKKMNKSKFSGRVCLLAENLHDQLEYLNHMWELFT